MDKRRDEMVEKIARLWDNGKPHLDTLERARVLVDNGVRTADGFEACHYFVDNDEIYEVEPINYSEVDNEG